MTREETKRSHKRIETQQAKELNSTSKSVKVMFRELYIRIALKLLRLWAKQNIKAELEHRGYMIIHTGAYLYEGIRMYVTDDFGCSISPSNAMIRKEQQEILQELHRVRCYFCILKIRNFREEYRQKQVNKKMKKL